MQTDWYGIRLPATWTMYRSVMENRAEHRTEAVELPVKLHKLHYPAVLRSGISKD